MGSVTPLHDSEADVLRDLVALVERPLPEGSRVCDVSGLVLNLLDDVLELAGRARRLLAQ